jgi:hypothetical protein
MLQHESLVAHWRAIDHGVGLATGLPVRGGPCAAASCAVSPDGETVVLRCQRPRGHRLPHRIAWPALDGGGGVISIEWRQPGYPAA